MNSMNKVKKVIGLVLDDIADFFPYFFTFYIVSLLLSFVFKSWALFFNWQIFYLSIFVLGILSLLSKRTKKGHIKLAVICIILIYSLSKGIGVSNFTALSYILVTIFFFINNRNPWTFIRGIYVQFSKFNLKKFWGYGSAKLGIYFSHKILKTQLGRAHSVVSMQDIIKKIVAVIALILLALCPLFLIYKKDGIAEMFATYAYYFLLVIVIIQIRDYFTSKKTKS